MRLVYQSKFRGSYVVLALPQNVQIGTVSKLDDGMWCAKSADGKAQFAFRLRSEAGRYLVHLSSLGGCLPGCTCAEG